MTFVEWLQHSFQRYRQEGIRSATAQNVRALARGGVRRLERGGILGTPIWERDWDVLVILDACRVDLWNETAPEYDLPQTEGVWSNGSCSVDWIQRNLGNHIEKCHKTGLVTGNPFTNHDVPNTKSVDLEASDFAYFAPLYRTDWQEVAPDIYTIPPRPLTNHAIQSWRNQDTHDMDRLIVHYMQPHQPFKTQGDYPHSDWSGVGNNLRDLSTDADGMTGACAWQETRKGNIRKSDLWHAYKDNLRWVLEDVQHLQQNINGQIAVSADHGNAMGEWGEWAHPPGALAPQVWRVPWVELDGEDRETHKPDVESVETDTVESEQLEALGYV